ncbi:ATP-binding protein [Methanolobus sediminis]|uniref:histidine kinase n=1 Tax=Methanolobus sediminis TaxID=3072978 RepID=A0AA51UN55_9EURY|nr:ATP-binding protein [Methanolobus sediminis]WMW25100.1 ATP-binding protein [Methanolobus sediminis]
MNTELIISLINNAALLLAIGVLYEVFFYNITMKACSKSVTVGIIIGLIGIALMLNPWELSPGIFFDTRTILLSTVALFFGFIPAVVGALIIISYRLYVGGVGMVAGVATTVSSVILGLLWRKYHERLQNLFGMFDLYVLGILVHIVMLMCMLLLPWPFAFEVLSRISFPVMLIYPIGTVLLGNLLKNQISRKRIQDALKENEAQLQNFIDNVPVGIYRTNYEGKMLQTNPEMAHILGMNSPKEAINYFRNMDERYISPNRRKELITILKKQGYVNNFECELLRADGKHIWLLIHARTSGDIKGDKFTIDGFAVDITEHKETEIALVKAKILAEESNRTKSEFLANMSHELRTPLNSVLGFSHILMDKTFGDLNDKQMKYVDHILKSGTHLLEVINDILDISKIESGNMNYEPEYINLQQVINEVVLTMEPMIKSKFIDFKFDMESENLEVYADKTKFKQIIFNLLSNAVKFTPNNGKVWVTTKIVNNNISVSISDTGIGISPKEQELIFKPFKQVDSFYNRSYEGTGLGLAIVKHYVGMHSGEMQVESEVGKGSTFTFTMPIDSI